MTYDPGSRARLGPRDKDRFPEDTLFHRIARVLCDEQCLPRKELFEAWEVARRARRRFRGGRVVDLACGHGLVAAFLLLLDDTSPSAVAADVRLPKSAEKSLAALVRAWPRLDGRVRFVESDVEDVPLFAGDLVVSAHACGRLTDRVLARATEARASVVVLPCCHSQAKCDAGDLEGWMDLALAIDATRALRLRAAGYAVHTQTIPEAITPKNRLLFGEPAEQPG
ncbi:MAG TPA: methyltransferase [Polyangiaceae bacterium]|nr:methyltransferase [Polyangiaceae bacterium]